MIEKESLDTSPRERLLQHPHLELPVSDEHLGIYFSTEQLPQELQSSTRAVGKLLSEDGAPSGSAALIEHDAKTYIVTAYHTMKRDNEVASVSFSSGDVFPVSRSLIENSTPDELLSEDVGIIQIEGAHTTGIKIASHTEISEGRNIIVVGFPEMIEQIEPSSDPLSSVGTILETNLQPGGNISGNTRDLIRTSARGGSGNSGGAVLNTKGEILAILTQGFLIETQNEGNEFFKLALQRMQELQPYYKNETLAVPIHKILLYLS